ncbi:MAG: type IV secretion system DNA-binding domain-containing protein [Candidatus Paceibacteria bacterium]
MTQFDPEKITFFAKTDARGKVIPFGIKARDRQRHMYVIGKTGMGKSTLLENMAAQDIQSGEGMAFIDPHGSAAEKLLEYIPEHRVNDVIYFAPFDLDNPVSFNVMEDVGPDKRHLVVSGLMSTFKKIWVDAWSARMEYILTNALLALIEYPDTTLLSVNRLFSDKHFRNRVVDYVKDPAVKAFWVEEFAAYTDRFAAEALPAIQNKIGQFTGNPLIRNIIGQPHSSFDIRKIMDEKKILIINLSKGLVGDTNANLLGSMLTTRIYLAAMSRADLLPAVMKTMPNFYFYVDEFQSFANATFANILSEARKYHLNLIIAHQYIEQMEEDVRNAVFGNVGTTVAFRVGPFDAEVLETIFTPRFLAADLVNLGAYQIYLTLMIDGIGSQPFSAVTLPEIPPPRISCRDMVIAASRKNFATPRPIVEKIITDLHTPVEPPVKPPKPDIPKSDTHKGEVKSTGASSSASSSTPKTDKPVPTAPARIDRPAPKPKPKPTNRPVGSEAKPKPTPTPVPTVTADGLKAVLARIAAATNDTNGKKGEDKPAAATSKVEATAPATDHRSALRSVLGSVLETASAPQMTVPAPVEKPEPNPQSTAPASAPVAPDTAYISDAAEPDIKVLKKILRNDAKVKSPF